MPFTVSLLNVVSIAGTHSIWPTDFAALVNKLMESPNEKTQWGVIADWLDEESNAEHELADAFRWVSKRPQVKLQSTQYHKGKMEYWLDDLPRALRGIEFVQGIDRSTVPGLMAAMFQVLKAAREELN